MRILDRLPVTEEHLVINVSGGRLRLKPFQIIVSVSISDVPMWNARTPVIPALLDTGNNHNFSIQAPHLLKWAGIHPKALASMGAIREAGRTPSLHFANVWIHRNQPSKRELKAEEPVMLTLDDGIAVYPADGSDYPRLPLLGLRAILKNKLKLVIDGKRWHASLRSPFR
jgi:hypothetical protein